MGKKDRRKWEKRLSVTAAANRQIAAAGAKRRRLKVKIRDDAYERLLLHCLMERTPPGRYLDELILRTCKAWTAVRASA
jgi:hypothetical protein